VGGLHYVVSAERNEPHAEDPRAQRSKEDCVATSSAPWSSTRVRYSRDYEEEYGTFGGAPYAAFIGDYEFSRTSPDIRFSRNLHVCAAAHAPFMGAAAPDLLNLESFTDSRRLATCPRSSRA